MSSQQPRFGLPMHQHGKSLVRLGRTWREGDVHHFKEWSVNTMLESSMENAFFHGDNTGMTATDTQKNTVYVVAQRMSQKCTVEEYATALAKHFVATYPLVSKAKVHVEEKPWKRVEVGGAAHDHGYAITGSEIRTAYVTFDKAGKLELTAGMKELRVLKTTQSGYEGFLRCPYTTLPNVKDRIVATSITTTWKYSRAPADFDRAFSAAREAIFTTFFGPAKGGVFSPSVQQTLYDMAGAIIDKLPEVESVFFNLPNIHFLPCTPVGSSFKNDVYIATSEPHGTIEAIVTRSGAPTQSKL